MKSHMNGKDEKIQEIYGEVLEKISEIELEAVKNDGYPEGWTYVRIRTNGEVLVGSDASTCYAESEYFNRNPHPLTVWSRQNSGSLCIPMGEGGVEVIPMEKEEFEEMKKLSLEKFGEEFSELDQSSKNDLAYKIGEFRPDNLSEFGFSKYDDSCGWVDEPNFDEHGETRELIEKWSEENLIVC